MWGCVECGGVAGNGRGGSALCFHLQLLHSDANDLTAYSQHSKGNLASEVCFNTCGVI